MRLHLTENAIVEEFFDVHHNLKAKGYVDFAIGMLAVSKQPDAAQALVKLMSSPPFGPQLSANLRFDNCGVTTA